MRAVRWLTAMLLLVLTICPMSGVASGSSNVIVIMLDDARFDEMKHLPVATSIGAAGAEFVNSYSPFPLCCPARASLLTGQYAHNHGVLSNLRPIGGFFLFDDADTIATWLAPTYTTGWIGKYLNEYGANGSYTYVPPGWDVWNTPDGSVWNYTQTRFNIDGRMVLFKKYQTDVISDLAVNFISTHASQPDPFFLVVSILAPHAGNPPEPDDPNVVHQTSKFPTPNVSPKYWNSKVGTPLPGHPAFNEANVSDKPIRLALLQPWEVAALREVHQQRLEAMMSAEDVISAILSVLASEGELENTYIIFTSDNGYLLGEHRFPNGKGEPYEMSSRVPLYIRGPGIPAGTKVRQLVGTHDLAPTILAMTERSGSEGDFVFDGVDLMPLISNPLLLRDRPIVLEAKPPNGTSSQYYYHGIRTPGWKYIERSAGGRELYDMVIDPHELTNRADSAWYAPRRLEMELLLRRYEFCSGVACR